MASFKLLKIIKPVFDKASWLAGLILNMTKCVLILGNFDDFDAAKIKIKEWLGVHLPDWSDFSIEDSHAYLGPLIGPNAEDKMWDMPIQKYWNRVLRIAACGFSAYFSILAYNTYAVSCLEYLRQMFWIPKRLLALEARAIAIILKAPYYTFGKHGPFQLKRKSRPRAQALALKAPTPGGCGGAEPRHSDPGGPRS